MATAEQVLTFALKHEGYTESPPGSNRTKFGATYGMDGYAWCAMFVWFVLSKKAVDIIKSAYTPTMAGWFKEAGRGFTDDRKAVVGDVVFFDFPDSTHRIQHVGFVIGNDSASQTLTTIEGNTSSGSAGSQDNGGGVFIRKRPYRDAVYYGRPVYEKAAPELPEFNLPESKDWFGRGDEGADIRNWQQDLNRWCKNLERKSFDFELQVDGNFGPDTVKATMQFQVHYGLDVDARVGQHTLNKMEKVRAGQRARKQP